jgi:ferrochelatase
MNKYDAILFVSFGGPEGMADVMPFLRNVLRGKNVPESRMVQVAHHYEQFNGVSPINGQNRILIENMKEELTRRGIDLPIYWGNRNWHPMLTDTIAQMEADGIKSALAFVTSAYSSYSGCRQYLEDIEKAKTEAGSDITVDKMRVFYNHPLFVEANIENVNEGLQKFADKNEVHVAFTAHSIPMAMANNCDYEKQLSETCEMIASRLGITNFKLVYQSRSGPPTQPWLEPDICDHMRALHKAGVSHLLIHPVGFVSDHMEILYDLDTEARDLAKELGMQFERTSTAGTNAKFASLMADLVEERLESESGIVKKTVGCFPARADVCPPDCCTYTPAARPASGTTTA